MFPFALISGYITEDFGQRLEVRILELEEDRAVFRTADRIGTVSRLEVYFYDDRAGQYDGIVLEHPAVTEILSKRGADPARQFYFEYEVQIAEESYKKAVQKLYVAYDHYIQKKLAGDDAALSEDYTGYPAKLDDVMNFLPARISALLMVGTAFISGKGYNGKQAWRIWRRDNRKHASPNSAQTESVCAGALGIQLAGDASYFGKVVKKPYIGDPIRAVEPEDIRRTNRLMNRTAWICEILCLGILIAVAV